MRLAGLVLLVACSSSPSVPPEPAAGCNPLIGDDCVTPYPSSYFQAADGHVAIPANVLPNPKGITLSPDRANTHDGFSPSTPFIVYFARGVDGSLLPTLDGSGIAQSIQPSSHVQMFDYATGDRVPLFAELDANATGSADRQALLIHPMVRLSPSTRYVIALVGLTDPSGAAVVAPGFAALRDKTTLNAALTPLAPGFEDLFTFLGNQGIARAQLTLAWDVTTASDGDATGHLFGMVSTALAMVDSLTWTITQQTDTGSDATRLREIVGTFQVPSFLSDDTTTGTLLTDGSGNPMLRGSLGSANFVVEIPACAGSATAPLPVMVYGHGLFGTAQGELDSKDLREIGQYTCMVQIGTDWLGLSQNDLGTIASTIFPDFNQLHIITDRLQQAHVNAQVLTRLVLTKLKSDPALMLNGAPIIDGSTAYYFGISNGGIQGATYMALAQDVTRGALNVPGAEWSLLMFRSADFNSLLSLLDVNLPDKLDQQILVALFQPEFDFTDPAGFASHIDLSSKQILMQEGIGDCEVTNVATRVLARELGVPGLDLEQPVFDIDEQMAPLPSAYTQWDITPSPLPPAGDTPASSDNGVHATIHTLLPAQQQIKAFLAPGGMVTDVCNEGPCVCNIAGGTCELAPGV